jgi:YHS domain-containing protein
VDIHDQEELKPVDVGTDEYSKPASASGMDDLGPVQPPGQSTARQSAEEAAAAPLVSPQDPKMSPGRSPGSPGKGGKTALEWAKEQDQFAHLPPLPQGWIRVKSQSTGRIYYFNMVTGKTTFTEPSDLPPGWVQIKSRSTGQPYYWNAQLKKSQFERPTTEEGGNVDAAASK